MSREPDRGDGDPRADIRPLEPGDLAAVERLEREIYPTPWRREHFERTLDAGSARTWVATEGGEVIGYAVAWSGAEEAELANIAVAGHRRRRGVGRRLLETVERWAAGRGARRIYLEVREGNAEARSFYRDHGYRPVGRRSNYYRSPREDAITLVRELAGAVAGDGPSR